MIICTVTDYPHKCNEAGKFHYIGRLDKRKFPDSYMDKIILESLCPIHRNGNYLFDCKWFYIFKLLSEEQYLKYSLMV